MTVKTEMTVKSVKTFYYKKKSGIVFEVKSKQSRSLLYLVGLSRLFRLCCLYYLSLRRRKSDYKGSAGANDG
jgi:hypothetical protein